MQHILDKHPTPLYVFDMKVLEERIQYLRDHLPKNIDLCYAIKANPFVVKEMDPWVDRFEVCSPGELEICETLGLPAEKIVVSGVYKTPSLMRELIQQNPSIGHYTVESMQQFSLLKDAAAHNRRRITLLLRLTSQNQFGMSEEDIEEILRNHQGDPYVDIAGIQYFSGTQKGSLKKLRRELTYVDHYLEKLETSYGFVAKELEFGAGLPVSYFEGEVFDEDAFLAGFSELLEELETKAHVTIELGRSIVASCGTYMTRVVDIKSNFNQNYAIVDGGIHQLVYYGQSMAMKHPIHTVLPHREGGILQNWNVCGALCTINDILVKQLPMADLELGDVIAFANTGAYCMTEGIALFLSRDLPTIVLQDKDGNTREIRARYETAQLNTPHYE